jgi:hypothetical protein
LTKAELKQLAALLIKTRQAHQSANEE